jgi:hypothetical protein
MPPLINPRHTLNMVWDTGTLAWVAETQPTGGGGGGAVTVADGANVVEGSTTDVAVQGDNTGTISAKLRGLNKSIAAGLTIATVTPTVNVLTPDVEVAQTTLTSGGGGWSTLTITTSGPGTLYLGITVNGPAIGTIGVQEVLATGGTLKSAAYRFIPVGGTTNPVAQYERQTSGTIQLGTSTLPNGSYNIAEVEVHGVSVTLTNNVTSGNAVVQGCFKKNLAAARPVLLQGGGGVAGSNPQYVAEVDSLNQLMVSRTFNSGQQWVITPGFDSVTNQTNRAAPMDGNIGFLFNGTSWDRPRGDATYGARQYQSHSRRQNITAGGFVFSAGLDLTAINTSHFTTGDLTATCTPILGVWNPNSNTKSLYIIRATLALTLTALNVTGPGPFVWAMSTGNTSGSPAGSAAFNRLTLAASGSNAKNVCGTALTNLTTNLTTRFGSSLGGGSLSNQAFTATAVAMQTPLVAFNEEFDGDLVIPPGGVLALLGTTTPAGHSAAGSILWEEV